MKVFMSKKKFRSEMQDLLNILKSIIKYISVLIVGLTELVNLAWSPPHAPYPLLSFACYGVLVLMIITMPVSKGEDIEPDAVSVLKEGDYVLCIDKVKDGSHKLYHVMGADLWLTEAQLEGLSRYRKREADDA